ncbi:hypothetical protein KQX54_014170 [Cotesia glomerata]|uniref:Peptidase A2 domain-containing protein n=1 Tax=Cotesia glomerata TaxID=32391 RepID=A0AAV7IHB2_COTGL|nr:hypothetical protein KQX54_014170 [Cotesia glomerata]
MFVSDNFKKDTRLDTPTCGPERGKSNNLFDSDSEDNIQETYRVKQPCPEEVLRVVALLEDLPSDLSDDFLHSCIIDLQLHSDENSEPEQASDSEWEDEVETLCEPAVSQPAVPTNTNKPLQASFIPHILQGKPLAASFIHKLAARRIFKPGNGSPPEKTLRIPISVWIFGVRLHGILDTGSERSYINEKVYEDIKHLAVGELQDDQTKKGVLLANHSTCKSRGGAPFIIQIGSVAGEQYLSVLPDLAHGADDQKCPNCSNEAGSKTSFKSVEASTNAVSSIEPISEPKPSPTSTRSAPVSPRSLKFFSFESTESTGGPKRYTRTCTEVSQGAIPSQV